MNQIQDLLARPKLYYNIDGVGELGIGFMCVGYALLGWLQLHAPKDSTWHSMYTFIIYVTVMTAIISCGSKAIKNRITYRRTGFVDYRPRDKYWVPLVSGTAVSALVLAGLYLAIRQHWTVSTPASLIGLLIPAAYIRLARAVHWKWITFSAMVTGAVAIAVLPVDLLEAFANHSSLTSPIPAKVVGAFWLTFLVCGSTLMVSGGVSFWLYLRRTQPLAQAGQ